MKFILLTVSLICFIIPSIVRAQDVKLQDAIYTGGDKEFSIELKLELPQNTIIDDETFNFAQPFEVTIPGNGISIDGKKSISLTRSSIILKNKFISGPILTQSYNEAVSVSFANGLEIALINNESGAIKKEIILNESIEGFFANKSILLKDLINKSNYASITSNFRMDVGYSFINSAEERPNFILNYNYKSDPFFEKLPLYFESSGIVSTNSKDSLNNLKIYPLAFKYFQYETKLKWELVGKIGSESDQTFSTGRFTGDVSLQGIIPNLINLTANFPRIRLKPVLKIGVLGYSEYKANRPEDEKYSSYQPYMDFYYYIPIFKSYSIIVDFNSFYEANKKINTKNEVNFNYSIKFGIDIPKTEFKVLFKYQKGTNNVTMKEGEIVLVGLLLDLVETTGK